MIAISSPRSRSDEKLLACLNVRTMVNLAIVRTEKGNTIRPQNNRCRWIDRLHLCFFYYIFSEYLYFCSLLMFFFCSMKDEEEGRGLNFFFSVKAEVKERNFHHFNLVFYLNLSIFFPIPFSSLWPTLARFCFILFPLDNLMH